MSDLVRSEEKGMEQEKKNGAQDDEEDTSDYGVGGETVDKEVEAMLTAIYLTQLRSNIVSVVMVALLVVLIILVQKTFMFFFSWIIKRYTSPGSDAAGVGVPLRGLP